MEERIIGYLSYKFRIYFDENKIEILNRDYEFLKELNMDITSDLENILTSKGYDLVEFLDELLTKEKLNTKTI